MFLAIYFWFYFDRKSSLCFIFRNSHASLISLPTTYTAQYPDSPNLASNTFSTYPINPTRAQYTQCPNITHNLPSTPFSPTQNLPNSSGITSEDPESPNLHNNNTPALIPSLDSVHHLIYEDSYVLDTSILVKKVNNSAI